MKSIDEQIRDKAEDFARLTAPIYKDMGWNWRDAIPYEQQIKEHILYTLMPSVKAEAITWNKEDDKHYQSSSGGVVIVARTYKNSSTVEISILFDISRKYISWHVE